LERFCNDDVIEIDNSAADRAWRVITISRRNYLFADADSGGNRVAVIYSLISTTKLNGFGPEA
jgi:transposase